MTDVATTVSQAATEGDARGVGIGVVSEQNKISADTLRWYEREGLIPGVLRSASGQRRYTPSTVRFVQLVQALRRTGMPVAEVSRFVRLGPGTTDVSVARLEILERQSVAIDRDLRQLREDREVIDDKMAHYRELIAAGLDCEDEIFAPIEQGPVSARPS